LDGDEAKLVEKIESLGVEIPRQTPNEEEGKSEFDVEGCNKVEKDLKTKLRELVGREEQFN
jgi:hypothetical protein